METNFFKSKIFNFLLLVIVLSGCDVYTSQGIIEDNLNILDRHSKQLKLSNKILMPLMKEDDIYYLKSTTRSDDLIISANSRTAEKELKSNFKLEYRENYNSFLNRIDAIGVRLFKTEYIEYQWINRNSRLENTYLGFMLDIDKTIKLHKDNGFQVLESAADINSDNKWLLIVENEWFIKSP